MARPISSTDEIKSVVKKRRGIIVGSIFVVLAARVLLLHYERHQLYKQLVKKYDNTPQDGRISKADVVKFLRDNGVNVTKDQFGEWVGNIDDELDGFDEEELYDALEFFDHFGGAKENLTTIGQDIGVMGSLAGDLFLFGLLGCGLAWIVSKSEHVEKKLAATSFVSAVKMKRMQRQWQALESKIDDSEKERTGIESEMKALTEQKKEMNQKRAELEAELQRTASDKEEAQRETEAERQRQLAKEQEIQDQLEKHRQELDANRQRREEAENELRKLRDSTEAHMKEAHMSVAKLKTMTKCLRGINAVGMQSPFQGAGEGKYVQDGAKTGFSMRGAPPALARSKSRELDCGEAGGQVRGQQGFMMERFVFGYPTEDDVVLFEVDKKKDHLGDGVDGAYKCRDIATNEKFALKIYEIRNEGQKRQILNDLRTKQSIRDHPHIVKYHNVIETQEQIYVLMELIPGKDLFTHIVESATNRGGLDEKRAAVIFAQICGALKFLHDSDIMHGDVKPENVMVVDPDGDAPTAKLIDFGFACFIDGQEAPQQANAQEGSDGSGSPSCESAEMSTPCVSVGLTAKRHSLLGAHCVYDIYSPAEAMGLVQAATTKEVDMFRLGCTLYVMVMATWPFLEGSKSIEARRAGAVMQYPNWKHLSAEVKDLIIRLCRDRMKVDEVMKHPWLALHGVSS